MYDKREHVLQRQVKQHNTGTDFRHAIGSLMPILPSLVLSMLLR